MTNTFLLNTATLVYGVVGVASNVVLIKTINSQCDIERLKSKARPLNHKTLLSPWISSRSVLATMALINIIPIVNFIWLLCVSYFLYENKKVVKILKHDYLNGEGIFKEK